MKPKSLSYSQKVEFLYWLLKNIDFTREVRELLTLILSHENLVDRVTFIDSVIDRDNLIILRNASSSFPPFTEACGDDCEHDIDDYCNYLRDGMYTDSERINILADIPSRHSYEEYMELFIDESSVSDREMDFIMESIYNLNKENYYILEIDKALDKFDFDRIKELINMRGEEV